MNLEEIKNRIYEAEGLLELATLRPEKVSDLLTLAIEKMSSAYDGLVEITSDVADEDIPDVEVYPESEETPEEVLKTEPEPEPIPEPEEELEVETEEIEPEEDDEETGPAPGKPKRPVPAFCLNDRFRFRRAIFGGSDQDFKAAMEHLATLDSYDEAEDLFFGDLNLDPEDPDVVDFMNVIKNYFGV